MENAINENNYKILDNKIIIHIHDRVCESADELVASALFRDVLKHYIQYLIKQDSPKLQLFSNAPYKIEESDIEALTKIIQLTARVKIDWVSRLVSDQRFIEQPGLMYEFIEGLYDYWRKFERFLVCNSDGDVLDKRPYRTFDSTVETLMHLVRGTYRDIQENLSGKHPRIYRQVSAGAEVSAIALRKEINGLGKYQAQLESIPIIRQVCLYPPMLLNPPMNKRTGSFVRVTQNPLEQVEFDANEWLCYPASVGKNLVLVYFHEKFFELGFTMSNLFELADDKALTQKPDAILLFGMPENSLDHLAKLPTIIYDDGDLLVGAFPRRDEFGYFGYLKKMTLTLHNIKVMKQGNMPYHGAMVQLLLKGGSRANVVIIGDTGAGKSETLEAFRELAGEQIRELVIIADDMGSFELGSDGRVLGMGTEIGAFIRLDDLRPGYAFSQLDRSIIMNPNQTNARVVLPVTTLENVTRGVPVDIVLYANNYEKVSDDKPVLQFIENAEDALNIFREGTSMSKGTTTSTGLVHTYFVNVFGPLQYPELHDIIAPRFFAEFFKQNVIVAQLRTQLAVEGMDRKGPAVAARALLELIQTKAVD